MKAPLLIFSAKTQVFPHPSWAPSRGLKRFYLIPTTVGELPQCASNKSDFNNKNQSNKPSHPPLFYIYYSKLQRLLPDLNSAVDKNETIPGRSNCSQARDQVRPTTGHYHRQNENSPFSIRKKKFQKIIRKYKKSDNNLNIYESEKRGCAWNANEKMRVDRAKKKNLAPSGERMFVGSFVRFCSKQNLIKIGYCLSVRLSVIRTLFGKCWYCESPCMWWRV